MELEKLEGLDPYAKHDEELVALLNECLDDLNLGVQQAYLMNLLTYPRNKNKTILEVLKLEVKAKADMEADYKERTNG